MSSSGYVFEIKPKRAWVEVVDDHYDEDGNLEDYRVFLVFKNRPDLCESREVRLEITHDWDLEADEIEELEIQNRENARYGHHERI